MVSWRTVTGKIELLDPQITSATQIQEFFAAERLLGRGTLTSPEDQNEPSTQQIFHFELAIAGRRRRVATLDEAGEIILGHTTSEVLESLARDLHKVSVELDGKTIHGPIDIGAVGVDEADLLVADLMDQNSDSAKNDPAANEANNLADTIKDETEEQPITGAQVPSLATGPTLLLGEFPLSELPLIATSENAKLLNFRIGALQAVLLEDSLKNPLRIFPRPELAIELSLGTHNFATPTLVVLRNSRRSVWEWKGEMPLFDWFTGSRKGVNFVRDELGAGAIARVTAADILNISFDEIREALLAEPTVGARKLAQLFGLPAVALQFLSGNTDLETAHEAISNSRIFQPGSRHETFRQTIAWEVAGEGVVDSDVADVYRRIYLKRPWLVSLVAAGQAAIGGALMSASLRSSKKSKLSTILGGFLVLNAASRILTTSYVQDAFESTRQASKNNSN